METAKELMVLGKDLVEQGNYDEGFEALKRSLRTAGENTDIPREHFSFAKHLFEKGDLEHCRIFLEYVINYYSDREAYMLFVRIFEEQGDYENAGDYYARALTSESGVEEHKACAKLFAKAGAHEKTYAQYKAALAKKDDEKDVLFFLAEYTYRKKAYAEAVTYYLRIMKYGYGTYADCYKAGYCFHSVGEYKKATAMYEKAIDMFPRGNEFKEYLKGVRGKKIEDYYPNIDEQLKTYTERLRNNTNDYDARYHLGHIALIKGDYKKATALFEEARKTFLAAGKTA